MMGGFGWMAMSLGWLVFVGLTCLVVWLVVRNTGDRSGAREVLTQRYARGEINDQEYHQRLRTLGS